MAKYRLLAALAVWTVDESASSPRYSGFTTLLSIRHNLSPDVVSEAGTSQKCLAETRWYSLLSHYGRLLPFCSMFSLGTNLLPSEDVWTIEAIGTAWLLSTCRCG